MDDLIQEIKELIIEALMLEETPEEIETDEPLFIEGLGLDSIDALELAIALEKRYGLKLEASDEEKREIFRTVRTLAKYVSESRAS